jgi:hypothetical protein
LAETAGLKRAENYKQVLERKINIERKKNRKEKREEI